MFDDRVSRKLMTSVACGAIAFGAFMSGEAHGQQVNQPISWCRLPVHKPKPGGNAAAAALVGVGEVENNDTPGTAQVLPFGDGVGEDRDLDISGTLSTNSDVDYYRVGVIKGDVLGLAVLGGGEPDTIVAVTTTSGTVINSNDDHGGVASLYPPSSPLPGGSNATDSVFSYVVPADGDLLVRVTSFNASSSGPYTLQIRGPRPYLSSQPAGTTQTIFLDFDGASINAVALFGQGNNPANLSPLSSFLGGWGLSAGDESAVIDAIIASVQENLDDLRIASLNGDHDTDGTNGHMDYVLLNSLDHADPFGQSNVSRLIFGGTINQLGILTIGIAEWIDPGNFEPNSSAVILLDILSASSTNPDSVNFIPLSGISKIDAVGLIVGAIGAHEAGHYLGSWHTDETNNIDSIMDQGGNIPDNIAGVGPDGILGTADDEDVDLSVDAYFLTTTIGLENTDVRTAFALSTGGAVIGCTLDSQCDDGNDCNGTEICDAGTCINGTPAGPCACNADVNNDASIDLGDFIVLMDCIQNATCDGCNIDCDINGDATVDFIDVGVWWCSSPQFGNGTDCCNQPAGACLESDPAFPCVITSASWCTIAGGTYLGDSSVCPPDPPVMAATPNGFDKIKYLSIDATTNGTRPLEISVTETVSGKAMWVDAPTNPSEVPAHAVLVDTPQGPRDWSADTLVNITGCIIQPGGNYDVVFVDTDNSVSSAPLNMNTTPLWGMVNADTNVNVLDTLETINIVTSFGLSGNVTAAHADVADDTANGTLNVLDILSTMAQVGTFGDAPAGGILFPASNCP